MKTVKEVSRITGVSIRTLHHYDAIGLLKPTELSEAGYRLYDGEALKRIQSILFFKELGFPLKEIKEILDSPGFDLEKALCDRIKLLEMERDRLESIIRFARETKEKGIDAMKPNTFDTTDIDGFKEEARQKWGSTAAFKEYEARGKNGFALSGGMSVIFEKFGRLKGNPADGKEAQETVKELKDFITENCYTCTDEILRSLGEMYVSDERFKKHIDSQGGTGTAEFTSRAIKHFCGR